MHSPDAARTSLVGRERPRRISLSTHAGQADAHASVSLSHSGRVRLSDPCAAVRLAGRTVGSPDNALITSVRPVRGVGLVAPCNAGPPRPGKERTDMNTAQKCPFGGTLMAAGVANAQQLDFAINYGGAYPSAFTTANAVQYVDFAAAGPVADAIDGGAIGSMTNTTMNASADGLDQFAQSYVYVIQAVDTVIEISWDFGNEDPGFAPFFSDVSVIDWSAGGLPVFLVDPSADPLTPTSGTQQITLLAGVGYGILLEAGPTSFDSGAEGSASASLVVIPAPGAATLAGLAGLAALRRRR